jgi:putative PIN family toxin of toxin-antitoxin system
MRAVLDTVIFVRALINPKGTWGRLLFDLSDGYVIVLSPAIIREIVSVLYRPGLRKRFPQMAAPPELDRVLELFQQAEIVEPPEDVSVCRDPADDKFFACALAGHAACIVTEDNDILDAGEYQGVRGITAEAFLAMLEDG